MLLLWISLQGLLLARDAHAAFSTGCAQIGKRLGLNLTDFWTLSRKHLVHKSNERDSERRLESRANEVSKLINHLLPQACPCAVVVSSAWLYNMWMQSLDSIAYTRNAYEYIWHTLNLEEKILQEALVRCNFNAAHRWPVRYALQLYQHAGIQVKQRIADVDAFYTGWGSQVTITDDQHVQALADASAIFGHLKLEWWPCRGTLIALLRHGKRSGLLSKGKVDAVDHDIDLMVALPSLQHWPKIRASIRQMLLERGWETCIGGYSLTKETALARANAHEDMLMCTKGNPRVDLDIATYITEGSVLFAQKYCLPQGLGADCWVSHDGTFHGSRGKLRLAAVRPLGRCKAGTLSVPCPRKPLEVLKASSPPYANMSCVALPDVADRIQHGTYASARNSWLSDGLTPEDVDILRARAAELDREGYMSMAPYFDNCRRSAAAA